MDKNEKILMKKYARYSKQSPKSVSAVLRQPTLTNSNSKPGGGGGGGTTTGNRRYQSTINKQTSLSQLVLSKFYVNSSAGNVSKLSSATTKCMSTVGEATNSVVAQSQNNSLDTPTQENAPSTSKSSHNNTATPESFSVVSSKISLFKKTV